MVRQAGANFSSRHNKEHLKKFKDAVVSTVQQDYRTGSNEVAASLDFFGSLSGGGGGVGGRSSAAAKAHTSKSSKDQRRGKKKPVVRPTGNVRTNNKSRKPRSSSSPTGSSSATSTKPLMFGGAGSEGDSESDNSLSLIHI